MSSLVKALQFLTRVVEANGGEVPEELPKIQNKKPAKAKKPSLAKARAKKHFYGNGNN